jgi:hypothetical protein
VPDRRHGWAADANETLAQSYKAHRVCSVLHSAEPRSPTGTQPAEAGRAPSDRQGRGFEAGMKSPHGIFGIISLMVAIMGLICPIVMVSG